VSWEKSKESKDKQKQLETLKLENNPSVTPTEKLVTAITPVPTTTTTTPTTTTSYPDVLSSSHSSINFAPPSYSFEGLAGSTSMQPLPTTSTASSDYSTVYPTLSTDTTSPPWEPQNLKQLKKPLLS